jgi:hypothetical protein
MSSTAWRAGVWLLVALVVAYSVVVAARPLLGVFVAAGIYAVAWLVARASSAGFREHFSSTRLAATGALVALVVAYSLLIEQSVLLGFFVAVFLVAVSWVTSPKGPVAAWLSDDGGV